MLPPGVPSHRFSLPNDPPKYRLSPWLPAAVPAMRKLSHMSAGAPPRLLTSDRRLPFWGLNQVNTALLPPTWSGP